MGAFDWLGDTINDVVQTGLHGEGWQQRGELNAQKLSNEKMVETQKAKLAPVIARYAPIIERAKAAHAMDALQGQINPAEFGSVEGYTSPDPNVERQQKLQDAIALAKAKADSAGENYGKRYQTPVTPGLVSTFGGGVDPNAKSVDVRTLSPIGAAKRGEASNTLGNARLEQTKRANDIRERMSNRGMVSAEDLPFISQYMVDKGVVPPTSSRNPSAPAIIHEMNKITQGDPSQVVTNAATLRANSTNLSNLTKMQGNLRAFERNTKGNLDAFVELAKKIPDTGIPILNTPVRSIAGALGNENVAAFNAQRDIAVTEISRVVNSSNLLGQLNVETKREAQAYLPANATLGQTLRLAALISRDLGRRASSLDQGVKEATDSIRRGQVGPPARPAGVPATATWNPLTEEWEE